MKDNYRGEFINGLDYFAGDRVLFKDKIIYRAKTNVPKFVLPTDNIYWTIVTAISFDKEIISTENDRIGRRDGLSAYQIAVKNGFEGSEIDWLESLKAPGTKPYNKMEKINDYLYSIDYDNIDYDYATKYFNENHNDIDINDRGFNFFNLLDSGESRIIQNVNKAYNNEVEFIVRTKGKHSVLGIMTGHQRLTKDFVESGVESELYKLIPFMITSGINDSGLGICSSYVSNEKGSTIETNKDGNLNMSEVLLTRYFLDNCSSVDEVKELINNLNIHGIFKNKNIEEIHIFIYEKFSEDEGINAGYIEFINNELIFRSMKDGNYNWTMSGAAPLPNSNFYIDDVEFEVDFTNYKIIINKNTVTPFGKGVEIIEYFYYYFDQTSTVKEMLESLKYTNFYSQNVDDEDFWKSELTGKYGDVELTNTTDAAEFADALAEAKAKYAARSRDTGDTMHTVHSAMFNLSNLTIEIAVQEDYTKWYKFSLVNSYTKDEVDALLASAEFEPDNYYLKINEEDLSD